LWDLSVNDLDTLAVSLEEKYNNSKGKSFLDKKTTKDKNVKLQFDIVLDILQSKIEEMEILRDAKETKEYNQKILGLIQEKKEDSLKGKTIKELESLLRS
jgi:hypothetical protein